MSSTVRCRFAEHHYFLLGGSNAELAHSFRGGLFFLSAEFLMSTFTIQFADDGRGEPKRVEFEGDTPAAAFGILEREGAVRHAKIWEGSQYLGDIVRDRKGIWQLNSDAPAS